MAAAFVVRRRVRGEYGPADVPRPADQYWAAFDTRPAAEAHARTLDRAERPTAAGRDPDLFAAGPGPLTSMPVPIFRDWLQDGGIDPPPAAEPTPAGDRGRAEVREAEAWWAWWGRLLAEDRLTPDQVARVCEALDRYTFHEVVEVPADRGGVGRPAEKVYGVVHAHWYYDDSHCCGANDALRVYRTRAAAEAERDRLMAGHDPRFDWHHDRDEFVVVELLLDPEG